MQNFISISIKKKCFGGFMYQNWSLFHMLSPSFFKKWGPYVVPISVCSILLILVMHLLFGSQNKGNPAFAILINSSLFVMEISNFYIAFYNLEWSFGWLKKCSAGANTLATCLTYWKTVWVCLRNNNYEQEMVLCIIHLFTPSIVFHN